MKISVEEKMKEAEQMSFPMNLVNGRVKLAILTLSVRSMKLNTD